MKRESYSVYEAKARLSEILRKVRHKHRVIITHAGVAVAEIVPFEEGPEDFEQRLDRLEQEGEIHPPGGTLDELACVARRPGALARFLAERED